MMTFNKKHTEERIKDREAALVVLQQKAADLDARIARIREQIKDLKETSK